MFLGIDFGTSNTSAAVYNGKEIVYIPLDPFNKEDVHVLGSMVYISSLGDQLFGHRAIAEYIERTAGRSIKMERKDYGDIEMTFAELGTISVRGFYLEEKDLPGRLFQYLKKYLGADFHTNVFGTLYKPYELVAFLLKYIKSASEKYLQEEIDGVVLGRPVKFSFDDRKNREAVKNLRRACHLAGFTHVEFQYEPVAAASNYSLTASTNENILIFDFGGGTFDVTIVNVQDKKAQVLGLGGVPVGGSDFDRAIMHEKIAFYFGRGARLKDGRSVPESSFLELLNWQTIMNLNRDRRFLRNLERWIFYAEDSRPLKALQRLVKEHHGFAIFQEIESAKKRLSSSSEATVRYEVPELFNAEGEIYIHQPISRYEFQDLLLNFSDNVFDAIDDTLRAANLKDDQIHHVIRVGGSSKIPYFHKLLVRKFGQEKIFMNDEFKNVAAGLAVEAFYN